MLLLQAHLSQIQIVLTDHKYKVQPFRGQLCRQTVILNHLKWYLHQLLLIVVEVLLLPNHLQHHLNVVTKRIQIKVHKIINNKLQHLMVVEEVAQPCNNLLSRVPVLSIQFLLNLVQHLSYRIQLQLVNRVRCSINKETMELEHLEVLLAMEMVNHQIFKDLFRLLIIKVVQGALMVNKRFQDHLVVFHTLKYPLCHRLHQTTWTSHKVNSWWTKYIKECHLDKMKMFNLKINKMSTAEVQIPISINRMLLIWVDQVQWELLLLLRIRSLLLSLVISKTNPAVQEESVIHRMLVKVELGSKCQTLFICKIRWWITISNVLLIIIRISSL